MITVKKCQIKDAEILQAMSIQTFTETFQAQNKPENMSAYMDCAYKLDKLKCELREPSSTFYFAYIDNELSGYIKVNVNEAQSEKIASNALEIERIYLKNSAKRKGLGRFLINHAKDIAVSLNKSAIWLGVWEHNLPAREFYKKMGFQQVGAHDFVMGDEVQTDFILLQKI